MNTRFGSYIFYAFALIILTLTAFWGLRGLNVPAGRLVDWITATVSLWWLFVVTTVPWNIYFEAKSVATDGEQSQLMGISIEAKQLAYVRKVAFFALAAALILHIVSAAVLFGLSYFGITPVGYLCSAAALLLTFLRPSVRGYEYLREKLHNIKSKFRYPREDILALLTRVKSLENQTTAIEQELNPLVPTSLAAQQRLALAELRQQLVMVTEAQHRMDDDNIRDHERIAREGKNAIAKISADSQFLDHVREIVQMIKSA